MRGHLVYPCLLGAALFFQKEAVCMWLCLDSSLSNICKFNSKFLLLRIQHLEHGIIRNFSGAQI